MLKELINDTAYVRHDGLSPSYLRPDRSLSVYRQSSVYSAGGVAHVIRCSGGKPWAGAHGDRVIVQPSVYGKDNACTLDMAAAAGKGRARAVAVVDDSFSDSQLSEMNDRGVRGIRVNALTPAGMPLDQIQKLAKRIAPLGWHMQFWISGPQLVALADIIRALPVPAVFDHMGQFAVDGGMDHPELKTLLSLLKLRSLLGQALRLSRLQEGPPLRRHSAAGRGDDRGCADTLCLGHRLAAPASGGQALSG